VHLWVYADTHLDQEDCLAMGVIDVDKFVGIDGFCEILPAKWLQVLDRDSCVKLPGYQAHNGSYERQNNLAAARMKRFRARQQNTGNVSVTRNGVTVTPLDLDLDKDLDQEKIKNPSASPTPANDEQWLLDFKLAYPRRSGDQGWVKAKRAANARIGEGHTTEDFIAGAKRYAAFCEATGKTGTEYVKQACTFLGPDKPFLNDWKPPPTKAEARQDRNISASQQWLAEQEAKDAAH